MGTIWELQDADREAFADELDGFVPPRVYDAHAHLYRAAWWDDPPAAVSAGPHDITLPVYREQMEWILPGREVHGLHFAYPFPTDSSAAIAAANAWVAQETATDPLARGQFLVRPTDDPEWVRQKVKRLGLRGFKPFIYYSRVPDMYQAELPDYFPEALAAVADDEGWSVTLHIVRSRGIADPSNQHWIRRYCETYPDMQMILDHCARGFNPYHVLKGLPALAGLANLWIDTSAVCNSPAVEAVARLIGPQRMLYGSDFYISHIRGTNFGVGDTFIWIDENTPVGDIPYSPQARLPLVGIENLRAVKAAFWSARLTDDDIEDYFWNNAAELLGLG